MDTVRELHGRIRGAVQDEEGATAVEYGIMVALIAIVIIAAVIAVGTALSEEFDCVADATAEMPQVAACVQ